MIFYTNANGLLNKVHELYVVVKMYNAKIICITETHLSPEIKDCEVLLENFKIYRVDRNSGKKCGGSCIYVHKSIDADFIHNFNAPDSVGIDVRLDNHFLKLICLYRSQNLEFVEQNVLLSQNLYLYANP